MITYSNKTHEKEKIICVFLNSFEHFLNKNRHALTEMKPAC